jgi:glycosyltransferase involved in cell wall biosynthesis
MAAEIGGSARADQAARVVALLSGPDRAAVSGVSTHLNLLFNSRLAQRCTLAHFKAGSEGRGESRLGRVARLAASPFALLGSIARHRADILHLNSGLTARAYWRDLAYLLVAKLCGARVVYQIHGGALPQHFFGRSRLLTAFLRMTLQWPDAIVVLASVELEAFRSFVPRQRVVMLPNAIDCAPFAALRRSFSTPDQPLRLLYIGRLAGEKGLHETLQAMRHLRGQGVKVHLTVAGGGPEEAHLKQFVRELGIDDEVTFAGPVFGEAKVRLLGQVDVFILASYAEGLPYALLESMAAGVPCIVTRVGAVPDVVSERVHGLFVPARDPLAISQAISLLDGNRRTLALMSAACRERVMSGYGIDRLALELAALYASLCGQGREEGAKDARPVGGAPHV